MKNFNLNISADGLIEYIDYRKCRGLLLAYLCDLPIVKTGFVIDSLLSKKDIAQLKHLIGEIVLCRPDSPIKQWKKLPRGKDMNLDKINEFYQECVEIHNRAVLLCFKHPSIYFAGEIIERYRISGGLNILVDWFKKITVEYVGPGFDVGELTRGCNNYHCLIEIPWELAIFPPSYIWSHSSLEKISSEKYEQSRHSRIDTLINKMGYNKIEVEQFVPQRVRLLSEEIFCNAFYECIKKIVKNTEYFKADVPIVILANLYGSTLHVFEIWESNT